MQNLDFISYIEEQNGIAEAVYLLEEWLASGCSDKLTIMRLLFLYWFMNTEPNYLTNDNGSRDWVSSFIDLLEHSEKKFLNDSDFNWVAGYLSCMFPAAYFRQKGEELLLHAGQLAPSDPLPQLAWQRVNGEVSRFEDVWDLDRRFEQWGMMGDYFRYLFT